MVELDEALRRQSVRHFKIRRMTYFLDKPAVSPFYEFRAHHYFYFGIWKYENALVAKMRYAGRIPAYISRVLQSPQSLKGAFTARPTSWSS